MGVYASCPGLVAARAFVGGAWSWKAGLGLPKLDSGSTKRVPGVKGEAPASSMRDRLSKVLSGWRGDRAYWE